MSSHHIVRDEQEPALLILTDQLDNGLIGNLLEWSPTVIIDADLVKVISECAFKIDIVIGEERSLTLSKQYLKHQEPIKHLSKNEGENTALQALYYLMAGNYKSVNILINVEQSILDILTPFTSKITAVLYDENYKWFWVKDAVFSKWMAKNQRIKLANKLQPESTINLIDDGNNYTVQNDGMIQIQMKNPGFWLGETI